MDIAPLDDTTAQAWATLFAESRCPCFCRWWHFTGTKNDWLARCANEPHLNQNDALTGLGAKSDEVRGLVALEGRQAIGWVKLAPRAVLSKALRQGPYRSLTLGSPDGVFGIGCFLVHPDHRRRGIARALVDAALRSVEQWGGHVLEAYPRRAEHELYAEEAWMGTVRLFTACGFTEIAGEGAYPVMRRVIHAASPVR